MTALLRCHDWTRSERNTPQFREHFASAYEARGKLAARIGISHHTLSDVLADSVKPMDKSRSNTQDWQSEG
jgi:hypothetical protein